jgi:hypothetical protein
MGPIWSAVLLVGALVATALYFFSGYYPPVGAYVVILGLAAALVTLRERPNKWEKAFWVATFFMLAVLEISNLFHDRAAHDAAEHVARENEAMAFKGIADGIDKSLKNDQVQFAATMDKINSTLQASQNAVLNTQPFADVRFAQLFGTGQGIPMTAGSPMGWNVSYINVGTAEGKNLTMLARMYIGKLDDKDAQKTFAKEFENDWRRAVSSHRVTKDKGLLPSGTRFFSFLSEPLSDDEVASILAKTKTIYVLSRFVWSDPNGRLASDSCMAFQDPMHDMIVGHGCVVFNRERYKFGDGAVEH